MENRFRSVFLALVFIVESFFSATLYAAESDEAQNSLLVEPGIERRVIEDAQIDSNDLELRFRGERPACL